MSQHTPNFNWDQVDRLKQDRCAVAIDERESQRSGTYQLSGYDPSTQNVSDYTNRMHQRLHFQKVYGNPYTYVNNESYLWFAEPTNPRIINQLYTRPYAGFYSGPGMPSLDHKDLESAIQQGISTNLRQGPCEACRGKSLHRFMCLPEFGNPQIDTKIIPPPVSVGGWIRGGLPSRDLARRVDYQRRCGNQLNNQIIYKP